jgi:ABC-2 type transport system permease protein
MRRYLRITGIFWGASVAAEMEYRINFLMAALTSVLTLGGSIITLALLYQHGYEMGGWTWPQAMIVMGIYTLLDGFQGTLLTPNRTRITEHVREGTLDFVLLKPVDAQFWLSARQISLWGLPNIIMGCIMLVYAGNRVEPVVTMGAYMAGLVPLALGMVVLYSIGYILATCTIWFVKVYNITIAMQALMEAGRYPIPAYPWAYRIFFTFVLPVAFMTTVPARSIIGRQHWTWLLGSIFTAAALFAIARWFWRFALRYYTSASS